MFVILAAQTPAATTPDSLMTFHPPIHAYRLTSPVTVDGILNEPVWTEAEADSEFRELNPIEGAKPHQRTEVRVAFDNDAIYIGARCWDTAPDSIIARLTRRDVTVGADRFMVYLDPYHDKRSGYYFQVNAAGTLYDGTLYNDGWDDNSWDGVWTGKAHRDAQGWTAEMRIPFSQLRYERKQNADGQCVWGINFRRMIARNNEELYCVYQPKKEAGFVSRFPPLVGLQNLPSGHAIELTPYVTSKSEFLQVGADNPFTDGSRTTFNGGGDLRMGVGGRLTLNGTVNPDFGQVEVDPAVVNLSDVETFYPEKRPFFVENSTIFQFGNQGANNYWGFNWPEPTFFYSRRIGRAPSGTNSDAIANADYTDIPDGTTILGAAKLTGKLSPSWNFGSVAAVTQKEFADISTGGVHTNGAVEPLTFYGEARGQKEFKNRQQGLGMMANLVARDFPTTDPFGLAGQMNRTSLVGGLDGWVFLDPKQTYVISGWSVFSNIQGTAAEMTDVQRSSRHYFQRPDADKVRLDSTATSLTGMGTRLWLNKQKGNVILNSAFGFMSPSFDVNDMGFMSRADVFNAHIGGGYRWTQPTKLRRYHELIGAVFGSADFDGNITNRGVWASTWNDYMNNWGLGVTAAYNPPSTSTRLTRGGPRTLNKQGFELGMNWNSDMNHKTYWTFSTDGYTQPEIHSWNYYADLAVEWKPVSNIAFSLGPHIDQTRDFSQYIETVDDPTATATYNQRYVFATIYQTTVAANIRVNWAFTPNVSFQLFAQPLIASGDYTNYKELKRPNSYDFLSYGQDGSTFDPINVIGDPDGAGPAPPIAIGDQNFNFRSLRGNAVFRWEYRPGSALYLVWTQQRSQSESVGDLELGHSANELINTPPDNIYLAKLTWYLNL